MVILLCFCILREGGGKSSTTANPLSKAQKNTTTRTEEEAFKLSGESS